MSAVGDHSNKRGPSRETTDYAKWRPNRCMQADRFARDRSHFDAFWCSALAAAAAAAFDPLLKDRLPGVRCQTYIDAYYRKPVAGMLIGARWRPGVQRRCDDLLINAL